MWSSNTSTPSQASRSSRPHDDNNDDNDDDESSYDNETVETYDTFIDGGGALLQQTMGDMWRSFSHRLPSFQSLDQIVTETAALVLTNNNSVNNTSNDDDNASTPTRQTASTIQERVDAAVESPPPSSSSLSILKKQDGDDTASTTSSLFSLTASSTAPLSLSKRQGVNDSLSSSVTTSPGLASGWTKRSRKQLAVVELTIDGMVCTMCLTAVENALLKSERLAKVVHAVKVSLTTDMARVQFHSHMARQVFGSTATAVQAMVEEIQACGFDVAVSSGSCIPNYLDENCNQDDEEAPCDKDDCNYGINKVESPQERAEKLASRQAKDLRNKRRAFLLSLLGTGPILIITMIFNYLPNSQALHDFWKHMIVPGLTREALALWVLCTPVQFISGWPFYKGAYRGFFKSGLLGMDSLIVIGTTAAYLYAVILVVQGMVQQTMNHHGSHFFETSAVLITFVLLGKWLQALAVRKTSAVLMNLMKLQGNTAVLVTHLLDNDGPGSTRTEEQTKLRVQCFKQGEEQSKTKPLDMFALESVGAFDPSSDPFEENEIPVNDVKEGDFLKIIRGASIPADGKIVHGEICVDESMITGESLPVLRGMGEDVLGGTICNEGTAFIIVTGAGNDTTLSKIVRLVEDAQMSRAPIQDFADRVSSVFVPTICSIALVSFTVWISLSFADLIPDSWYNGESEFEFSLLFGIAVLVISCPCALGLAAPTAIMVGTGVGASHGILIKGGEQLQSASSVTSVIFDKTGTLTVGKPSVTNFIRFKSSMDRDYLLWLVWCAEANSEHPLARALLNFAEDQLGASSMTAKPRIQPADFVATTGRGVECTVDEKNVKIGNSSFVLSNNGEQLRKTKHAMRRLQDSGKTAILIAVDKEVVAVVGIADEIKQESASTIRRIQAMGIEVWMVTGDNRRTALAVSKKLGLSSDCVIAEALPIAKVEKVRGLQSEGHCVAMIGDGINDSIALAQADVGIAIGTGDIAAEAADLVLVKGAIFDTVVAFDLSRKIFNRIKLNFVWALLYNCLGIPVAAGAFFPLVQERLPPTLAAAAMALSSICVVLSSLSLRWTFSPPRVKYT